MLEKQITTDTLTAMKNSDKFKVSVLRMLKSALQSEIGRASCRERV